MGVGLIMGVAVVSSLNCNSQGEAMFGDDELGLVDRSSPLQHLLGQVDQMVDHPTGITLCGEPGTGRGIVARALHAKHRPPEAPFVAVYGNALDRTNIERLLFGGPASAESRQITRHRCEQVYPGSILHQALGGTLYFRGLEELPAKTQSRLARLLRDRECYVGTRGSTITYDARPMAAVDPDVQSMIDDGRLRLDLYRRFSAKQISIPPLRECRADIPALAGYLLAKACQRLGIPAKTIDSSASSVLAAMSWRRNTRELMTLVEVLAIKVIEDTVMLSALLECIHLDGSPRASWNLGTSLRDARQHFEREYIAAVVAQHHGRVPDAARSLGIQRTNLYRKLRSLHIKPEAPASQNRTRILSV